MAKVGDEWNDARADEPTDDDRQPPAAFLWLLTEQLTMRITASQGLIWSLALMPIAATAVAAAPGQAVYEGTCIACHGADGKGVLPGVPDLTDPKGPLSKSDDVLIKHIIDGFQSASSPMAMPPKGGNPALTREDIEAVLRYMREVFGSR